MTTWKFWLWGWELPPIVFTWPHLIAEKALNMTAAIHESRQMTSSPLWLSWLALLKAFWLGSTGTETICLKIPSCCWPGAEMQWPSGKAPHFFYNFSITLLCKLLDTDQIVWTQSHQIHLIVLFSLTVKETLLSPVLQSYIIFTPRLLLDWATNQKMLKILLWTMGRRCSSTPLQHLHSWGITKSVSGSVTCKLKWLLWC